MSKSLDYCVSAVGSEFSGFTEVDSSLGFDEFALSGLRKWIVKRMDEAGNGLKVNVTLDIEPDAEFDDIIRHGSVHDGTLVFILKDIGRCIQDLCFCQAGIGIKASRIKTGDTIHYTVGNFVIGYGYSRYPIDRERPWMRERTVVMLPIKVSVDEKR